MRPSSINRLAQLFQALLGRASLELTAHVAKDAAYVTKGSCMPRTKISDQDPRPPYVQIADDLRAAIESGELAPGAKLPPGRKLAAEYGVAPMTVQHAIGLLRDEKRLETWQGRGAFVSRTADDQATPAPDETSRELLQRLDQLTRHVEALDRRVGALEHDE